MLPYTLQHIVAPLHVAPHLENKRVLKLNSNFPISSARIQKFNSLVLTTSPNLFLKITFQSFAANLKFLKNKKNFLFHSNAQRNKNLNFNKMFFTHLCQNFHALTQKNSFNSLMSLAHLNIHFQLLQNLNFAYPLQLLFCLFRQLLLVSWLFYDSSLLLSVLFSLNAHCFCISTLVSCNGSFKCTFLYILHLNSGFSTLN